MGSRQSRLLKILYCLIGIAVLIYSGNVVWIIVMHIWHGAPQEGRVDDAMPKEDQLYAMMTKGFESANKKAAYRNINDLQQPFQFHKARKWAATDARNLCVSCHGEIPHHEKKETRAFLNMHASFMACETCHIRFENQPPMRFVWYDRNTGDEHEKTTLERFSDVGDYPYKLLPVGNDGRRIYDNEKMKEYVTQFKSNTKTMSLADRKAAVERVHRPMAEVEKFLSCEECHTSDREKGYLPFRQVGYSERRIHQLVGNEVVGMIKNYKEFYLPRLLRPNEEPESEN